MTRMILGGLLALSTFLSGCKPNAVHSKTYMNEITGPGCCGCSNELELSAGSYLVSAPKRAGWHNHPRPTPRVRNELCVGPVIGRDPTPGDVRVAAVRYLPPQNALHRHFQVAVDEPGVVKQGNSSIQGGFPGAPQMQ